MRKVANLQALFCSTCYFSDLDSILQEHCEDFRLIGMNSTKTGSRRRYFVLLKKETSKEAFFETLETTNGLSNTRLERDDNLDKI